MYTTLTSIVNSSDEIRDLISSFGQNKYEIVFKALSWLKSNIQMKKYTSSEEKMAEWRKRTASQIYTSRYANGCTDFAILFCSFMRMAGISCSYIETVSAETIDKINNGENHISFSGHTFCQVTIDQIEFLIDPTNQQVFLRKDLPQPTIITNQYIFAEGEDYQQLGLISVEACIGAVKKRNL